MQNKKNGLDNIKLTGIEESYLDKVQELLNDYDASNLTFSAIKVYNKAEALDWIGYKNSERNPNAITFAVVFCDLELGTEEFAGIVQLSSVNLINSNAFIGIKILKKFRQKNVGFLALTKLLNFAKNNLIVNKVCAEVRSDNPNSLKLFNKLGFREVGFFEKHIKSVNNTFVDKYIFELIL